MSDQPEDKAAKSPKVTIRDTPAAAIVREALKEAEITDGRGRKIKLTRPPILAQFRLPLTVGAEAASNPVYMNMLLPVLFVSAIDGAPVYFPTTALEIDALIQRLDEDGVAAVSLGVMEHFGQADQDATKAEVKN